MPKGQGEGWAGSDWSAGPLAVASSPAAPGSAGRWLAAAPGWSAVTDGIPAISGSGAAVTAGAVVATSDGGRTAGSAAAGSVVGAAAGTASDDDFAGLVRHLASVHPSRYIRLIDGIDTIGIRGVAELDDQSAALRFVAFVDRAYDAQIPVRATGEPLDRVFAPEMLTGGYRKKYLRAISRLNALTHS